MNYRPNQVPKVFHLPTSKGVREEKLFPHFLWGGKIKDRGHEVVIDLFHDGDQIQYSIVSMLMSLSSLAPMGKLENKIYTKMRRVGLINIHRKGITNMPPFMKVVNYFYFHEEYFSKINQVI